MKEFLGGEVCKRVVLDREMDGRSREGGCKIDEERCDVCKGIGRKRKWVRVEREGWVEEIRGERIKQMEEMDLESETLVKEETIVERSTPTQREEANIRRVFEEERRIQESTRLQKI